MRFIVDAQLPPALARWLTSLGYEAEHVYDVGLAKATDAAIWGRATENVAVVVSKDDDFALRAQMATAGPAVVWVRYGTSAESSCFSGSPRRGQASWMRLVEARRWSNFCDVTPGIPWCILPPQAGHRRARSAHGDRERSCLHGHSALSRASSRH